MPACPSSPADSVRIAYVQARHLGLTHEDAQDCALDFRLRLLHCPTAQMNNVAWLHRCARNYACNYVRARLRRLQRERAYSRQTETGSSQRVESVSHSAGPKTLTMRKALWQQLFATLRQFTPEQQDLFIRYHIREQSLEDLSRRTGRSVHALHQALYQIRRRLAPLLIEQGWSAAEARQLFNPSVLAALPKKHS